MAVEGLGGREDGEVSCDTRGRLTPATVTIDLTGARLPRIAFLVVESEGYQSFIRPFLCRAGGRYAVQARLARSPESKHLDAVELEERGLEQPNASGLEVDLDCDGSPEIVVAGKVTYQFTEEPFPEVSVFRKTGQEYRRIFFDKIEGLLPAGEEALDLDCDGRPEVLLTWLGGGSSAWAVHDILFASGEDIKAAHTAGYHLHVAQLDEGGPHEIIIDELIGMARSKADATYHGTIWHWTGAELVDVSHKFPEYYTELEIPYYEALLQTTEVPGFEEPEYRAELQEALTLAQKVVQKARQQITQ
jgi:hypothetical protein